ncbi:hypothetical protein AVEN_45058-1 [Araneus ventricosus]|uniref:Uncharacterized protein n=1 Tax=Araneus ventricosus TaxID=182803 RepID=A0A4Y2QDL2_ARAVE|nr:hypothetical protein AVEN_45058-1 [Araneus ventricosus]
MVRLADRFTALYRKYKINSCTGTEIASSSPLATGPSPPTSRVGLHSTDYRGCGEIGNPLLYATRSPLTLSYHHKVPSPQIIVHWWKSVLSRKLSRRNIDHLITFLATNEDLIKSQNTTVTYSSQEIDTSKDSPPRTRNSINTQLSTRLKTATTHSHHQFVRNSFEKFTLHITANPRVTIPAIPQYK